MRKRAMWRKAAAAVLTICCVMPVTVHGAGWEKAEKGTWRYQREDGSYVANALTEDGYYIDGSGIWQESRSVLGVEIPNRNHFLRASQAGSMMEFEDMLFGMLRTIGEDCGNVRGVSLEERGIYYFLIDGQYKGESSEKELFSFYKDDDTDGYVLRLKCSLSTVSGSKARTSWYDYQVLSGILGRVSATGAQLAEAVYSSWEKDNVYGLKAGQWVRVGDAMVKYEAASGTGIYYMRAAEGGE